MNDAEKLICLADWFKTNHNNGWWEHDCDVQADLRDMAARLQPWQGTIPTRSVNDAS